jgi:beta-glucanase (GH16 family)
MPDVPAGHDPPARAVAGQRVDGGRRDAGRGGPAPRLAVIALALGLTLLVAGPAHAATATFPAVADTYSAAEAPSSNFGTLTTLSVQASPKHRAYLRFDVSLPAGAYVTKATLRVRALAPGGTDGVDLRGVADNTWGETSLTYANAPVNSGNRVAHAAGYGAGTTLLLSATPLVAGSGSVSMALTAPGSTPQTFASREASVNQPQLVVEYMNLVFDDEFDGTSIDPTKWNPGSWQSDAFYQSSNVLVSGGALHLRAASATSSAMVQTLNKFAFTYGRMEASVRVPRGQGFWPALWLRPVDLSQSYPEIDLLEMWMTDRTDDIFDENLAWFTYHWVDSSGTAQQTQRTYDGPDFTQDYHRFAIDWAPGSIKWYVDGVQRGRVTGTKISTVPMFLVYSLQVGHAWWLGADGDPNAATTYPSYLDADWVRVWQS